MAPPKGMQFSLGGQARSSAGDAHSTLFDTKGKSPGHSASGMHRIDKYPAAACKQQDLPFGQSDCWSQRADAPVEVGVPQKALLSMQVVVPAWASKQQACVLLVQVDDPHCTAAGQESVARANISPEPSASSRPTGAPVSEMSPLSRTHDACAPSAANTEIIVSVLFVIPGPVSKARAKAARPKVWRKFLGLRARSRRPRAPTTSYFGRR